MKCDIQQGKYGNKGQYEDKDAYIILLFVLIPEDGSIGYAHGLTED